MGAWGRPPPTALDGTRPGSTTPTRGRLHSRPLKWGQAWSRRDDYTRLPSTGYQLARLVSHANWSTLTWGRLHPTRPNPPRLPSPTLGYRHLRSAEVDYTRLGTASPG